MIVIILSISGLLLLVIIAGKINLQYHFTKEVKALFSLSKNISEKKFNYCELTGLPDPVQRYFKYVLREGQPYLSCARITHGGLFKPGLDKEWIKIRGEQYATTEKPGFIWKGTTSMFVARDMYIADQGRLVVSLFSLYKVADARGEHYNKGELLRWLGESVLYPTNLLPSERLQWIPVDSQKAKLLFSYQNLSLFFIISFDDNGAITQMETERYMDENTLATWVIHCSNYNKMNGVTIPMSFEVMWRLEKGDFPYARFDIEKIEYNQPEKF